MSLKRWRDRGVALALIGAGTYYVAPVILEQFGMLESWSGENMGTDISVSECARTKREIDAALNKLDWLDEKGQLNSEHCTSTRGCTDMKSKYERMLEKIERREINCPWRDEYDDKLTRALRELNAR